jgi:hypothetical protein
LFSIIFFCNSCSHRGVAASYWGLPFSALDSPSHATEMSQLVTEGCRFCSCFTITGHRGVAASHWGLLVSALVSPSQATEVLQLVTEGWWFLLLIHHHRPPVWLLAFHSAVHTMFGFLGGISYFVCWNSCFIYFRLGYIDSMFLDILIVDLVSHYYFLFVNFIRQSFKSIYFPYAVKII